MLIMISDDEDDPLSDAGSTDDDDSDFDDPDFDDVTAANGATQATNPSATSPPPHNASGPPLPPFYGRPPTPLPPSPSFSSLITIKSRPATPYASDDDPADPSPPTSPKVPTYEYYGFVLYLFSSLSFLIYLLWSFLPSPFLHALGIYYYPNRWWSLAVPSFLVMTVVYIYVALQSYNTEVLTLPLNAIQTIVDHSAQVAVLDSKGRLMHGHAEGVAIHRKSKAEKAKSNSLAVPRSPGQEMLEAWCVGTDAVLDVPLAGVCEMLYARRDSLPADLDQTNLNRQLI